MTVRYTYLIVGGGMTADAAIEGIRQADPAGSRKQAADDRGTTYAWEKLLPATGGTPRRPAAAAPRDLRPPAT